MGEPTASTAEAHACTRRSRRTITPGKRPQLYHWCCHDKRKEVVQCLISSAATSLGSPAKPVQASQQRRSQRWPASARIGARRETRRRDWNGRGSKCRCWCPTADTVAASPSTRNLAYPSRFPLPALRAFRWILASETRRAPHLPKDCAAACSAVRTAFLSCCSSDSCLWRFNNADPPGKSSRSATGIFDPVSSP
jgi:hypothetical protein